MILMILMRHAWPMRGELPVVTGCFGLAVGHFLLVQNLAHSAISALRFSRRSERE